MMRPSEINVHRLLDPAPILRLLGSNDLMKSIWDERDLPALWSHQLQASLVAELRTVDPAWALLADEQCSQRKPPLTSFADLFSCEAPPLAVLDLVKRYAKHHLDPARSQVPREIAGGIYVLSMVIALAKSGASISTLSTEEIVGRARQLQKLRWIDEATRGWLDAMLPRFHMKG